MASLAKKAWDFMVGNKPEKRESSNAAPVSTLANPSPWMRLLLGGSMTNSGVQVNQETALGITALWRSIDILGSAIATLPFKVYSKEDNGNRKSESRHPVSILIQLLPNDDYLPYTFWYAMVANAILWGHGAARIIRNADGRPIRLKILMGSTQPYKGTNDRLYYQCSTEGGLIPAEDVLFIPGMLNTSGKGGRGIVAVFKEIFGEGIASQIFSSRFFKNGAAIGGYISSEKAISDTGVERLRKDWSGNYGGLDNVGKTAVLEDGLKFVPLAKTPKDTESYTVRKNTVEEVARITGVPMHKLMAMERATFNNIEAMNQSFVDDTLMPWIITIQQEVNRKLFYTSEMVSYYAEFNLSGRLRGDSKARAEWYNKLYNLGAINANEIRRLENMNAYEGGDRYMIQQNLFPADRIDEMVAIQGSKSKTKDGATKS